MELECEGSSDIVLRLGGREELRRALARDASIAAEGDTETRQGPPPTPVPAPDPFRLAAEMSCFREVQSLFIASSSSLSSDVGVSTEKGVYSSYLSQLTDVLLEEGRGISGEGISIVSVSL